MSSESVPGQGDQQVAKTLHSLPDTATPAQITEALKLRGKFNGDMRDVCLIIMDDGTTRVEKINGSPSQIEVEPGMVSLTYLETRSTERVKVIPEKFSGLRRLYVEESKAALEAAKSAGLITTEELNPKEGSFTKFNQSLQGPGKKNNLTRMLAVKLKDGRFKFFHRNDNINEVFSPEELDNAEAIGNPYGILN